MLGCKRSTSSEMPARIPDNRFPKAGMTPKKDATKGK
jgi:hypothetical protein